MEERNSNEDDDPFASGNPNRRANQLPIDSEDEEDDEDDEDEDEDGDEVEEEE
jgi:hypothetical protein